MNEDAGTYAFSETNCEPSVDEALLRIPKICSRYQIKLITFTDLLHSSYCYKLEKYEIIKK